MAEVGDAVGLAGVVDRDDVGVLDRGGRGGLLEEARWADGVAEQLRDDDLQRDDAVEPAVAGAETTPMPPRPTIALDEVTREDGAERSDLDLS